MSLHSRVAWKDGMFLLPQHFQQAERNWESRTRLLLLGPQPLAWGVVELALNEQALSEGRVELSRCFLLWPDGTPLNIPLVDAPPPALNLPASSVARTLEIFLALPARRSNVPLLTASSERKDARFIERALEVADEQNPDAVQTIDIAVKNLRLVHSASELDGQVAIKIAEVERTAAGHWALRRDFVPACPVITAAPSLMRRLDDLLARMKARADELSAKRKKRGSDVMTFNASDILSFWLLHTLNEYLLVLRHLAATPDSHPARLFEELLRLYGALLSFAPGETVNAPSYKHDAIEECTSALLARIHELLGVVVRERYTVIPLNQTRNVWDGRVEDADLLEHGEFYLLATGEIDRTEFERLPSACKIADSNRVESLARTANPGLELVPVPRPPAAVPVLEKAVYFRLRSEGALWQEIRRTGQIGIFVPRAPAGLSLELIVLFDKDRS